MASTSNIIQSAPSTPSSCSQHDQWKYHVFLSFRGETRDTFTSHLFNELRDKLIYTFLDDARLEIGRPIKKELLDAIEKSRMAVIVLSKEYASSRWCLEELAKIVECMKDRQMKVLPIFYHVDPTDVRHQTGTFRDAFADHEKNPENKDKVQTWRNTLKELANLTGHHLDKGNESKFIKSIVQRISIELSNMTHSCGDENNQLVGIDARVKEMYSHYLDIGSNDVRFIGICGMSGMGKTTLARVLFQRFNHLFRAGSFLERVSLVSKTNGLVALQEMLLSDMKLKDNKEKWDVLKGIDVIRYRLCYAKVLIVLDDVDEQEQLEALAGNCNWFGPGSRIIVTTKDKHLLIRHGVQTIYPTKGLHKKEALQLFSQKAFHSADQHQDQEFLDLCNDYVSYADGHPLTLKVLGSSLLGKGREVWKSSLDRLQVLPNREIQNKLKIGFDGLGDTEKKMFLDIACFFNGEDKDRVVDLLVGSDCFPAVDIDTLVDKSLITILERKLWMHGLLQRMGWEIVRSEYPEKLGKRSRLWRRDEVLEVLRKNSGTDKVQGIMLRTSSPHQEVLNPEAFSNMEKLRLFKISDVNLPRGLCSLSNMLRLIDWHKYPLGSLPESFQPSNLVELIMHHSSILQLPMAFLNLNKLKVMDFSGSENLLTTPDFSGCPSLQKLIFEGCLKLYEVHPSIAALSQLILLNFKDCKCLSSLLHEINMESLNLFILSGCSRFDKFPEIGHNMEHLSELYLDGTAIAELPLSIQHLTGLTLLNLGECKRLLVFPSVICCLPALKILILSGCKGQPPSSVLFSIGVPLTLSLPSFFSGLASLVALDLSDCNLIDGALPDDLSGLSSLESFNLSRNSFTRLPDSISQLPKLKFLYLDNCSRLQLLPNLPPSAQFVMARECISLQNYSNQVVVSSSYGGEFTVINCLSLAAREDDILINEVSLLDAHFQPPWMEEQIHRSEEYHGISQSTIPIWFNQKHGSSISISLPYDLSEDRSWRGIVLHVVLGTNKYVHGVETLAHALNNVHKLICSLDIDGGLATCSLVLPKYRCNLGGSFELALYISHARFGSCLDQRNCITARFKSNSPSIVIRGCGARILYENDMVEFVQILSQKNLGWIPPILVQKMGRFGGDGKFYVNGPPDFDASARYSFCFPPTLSKFQDWFTHQSCGQSVAVDIPPTLHNDDNWMGFVLYASFSICKDPETLPDNCQFRMGTLDGLDDEILSCNISRHEIKQFITLGGFCWIAYIPRNQLKDMLDIQGNGKFDMALSPQYSHIAASFASESLIITIKKCGLRLLYNHDQVQFKQELKHCNDLFFEYRDSTGPFMADWEKTNETAVTNASPLEIEISIRPILHMEKTNGTRGKRDFKADCAYDECFVPSKILEWFPHRSANSLVTIPLLPNDRTFWFGLAVCASLSVQGRSSNVVDDVDSRLPSKLICHLETDVDSVERFHTYCLTKKDLRKPLKLGGFIWLSYIPRGLFPDFPDECSWIDASISTDCPGSLMVQSCGFRLLYNEDELHDQFHEIENHCWVACHNGDVNEKLYPYYDDDDSENSEDMLDLDDDLENSRDMLELDDNLENFEDMFNLDEDSENPEDMLKLDEDSENSEDMLKLDKDTRRTLRIH